MPFDDLLQHEISIYVGNTVAEAGTGGRIESHATARALAVPCMIGSTSSSESEQWSQENLAASYKVALAGSGSGVSRGDVLAWVNPAGVSVLLRVVGIQYVPGMGSISSFVYVFAGETRVT